MHSIRTRPSRRSQRARRALLVLPLAVIALAGCGDDDDTDSGSTAAPSTAAPAASADAPATAAPSSTDATAASEAPATPAAPGPYGPIETGSPAATDTPDTTEGAAPSGAAVDVQLGESAVGEILVDGEGETLYLFTNDQPGVSNCSGDCLSTWPPLAPAGEQPAIGEGLDTADFAVITATDGSSQLTFHGWPLYYFAGDAAPGDMNGQAVGDVWWVIDAEGNAITAMP